MGAVEVFGTEDGSVNRKKALSCGEEALLAACMRSSCASAGLELPPHVRWSSFHPVPHFPLVLEEKRLGSKILGSALKAVARMTRMPDQKLETNT